MSTAYLARWSGPVAENDDPYSSILMTYLRPLDFLYRNMCKMCFFFRIGKDSLDNDEIKLAVQKYGAVFTSMYYDNAYYSPNKYSYYYNGLLQYLTMLWLLWAGMTLLIGTAFPGFRPEMGHLS